MTRLRTRAVTRARLIIAASEWRERRIRSAAERVLGAPCECGRARIGEAHGYAVSTEVQA